MPWVGASDSVQAIDSPGQGFYRVCSILKLPWPELRVDQARPADLPSHTGFGQQEAAWAQRPSVLQPEAGYPDPCPCLQAKTVQDSGKGLLPPSQETNQPDAGLPEALFPVPVPQVSRAGLLAILVSHLP